jgi:hypothetical protein
VATVDGGAVVASAVVVGGDDPAGLSAKYAPNPTAASRTSTAAAPAKRRHIWTCR